MKKTYFIHDSNARNDLKLIKLRRTGGFEYYGIYFAVLELLFTEENKLCIDDYDTLAFGLQCDADKLKSVIEDFDLFIVEDNCFYSQRLNNHIEEINNKSIKAKENAKKRWSNANVMQTQSKSNASKSISKENKSKSISKRIISFENEIQTITDVSNEDKKAFFLYWTEKNKSGTKFRAELEKTFDIERRLKRWCSNNFNKQKAKFPDFFDSLLMKRLDDSAKKEYESHLKHIGYVVEYNPNAGAKWIKK